MQPVRVRGAVADWAPAFVTGVRVYFQDTDAGGIVYFGRYGRYLERAIIAYRRAAGVPLVGEEGHLFAIRSFEVAYHAPLRFDDEVEVFVRLASIGTTSHAMEARLERIDSDGALHVADAAAVIVGVDSWDGGRPTPMPDSMRRAFEDFEARTH